MDIPLPGPGVTLLERWVSKRGQTTRLQQVDCGVQLARSEWSCKGGPVGRHDPSSSPERSKTEPASFAAGGLLERMGFSPGLIYADAAVHVRALTRRWRRDAQIQKAREILQDRSQTNGRRSVAVLALARLGLTSTTEKLLTQIALDHSENDKLRLLVLIFLQAARPTPLSFQATLRTLLLDPESETVRLESSSWSGTIQQMAADMMNESSAGRVVLQRVIRHPNTPYVVPWILAVIRLHGADPAAFLRLFADVVYEETNAIELRIGAVLALGVAIRGWPPGPARSGLDSLVSISLASSDDDRLRRAARAMLAENGR